MNTLSSQALAALGILDVFDVACLNLTKYQLSFRDGVGILEDVQSLLRCCALDEALGKLLGSSR